RSPMGLMGVRLPASSSLSMLRRERLSSITTSCPSLLRWRLVGQPQKPSPPSTKTFISSSRSQLLPSSRDSWFTRPLASKAFGSGALVVTWAHGAQQQPPAPTRQAAAIAYRAGSPITWCQPRPDDCRCYQEGVEQGPGEGHDAPQLTAIELSGADVHADQHGDRLRGVAAEHHAGELGRE